MKKNQLKKVNISFNFFISLVYIPKKFTKILDNNDLLGINLYEIRITEKLINDKQLLKSFLYECICALFLFDITVEDDFQLIKEIINSINKILSEVQNDEHFPPLTKIIINNKMDLDVTRLISSFEIRDFLDLNQDLINFDLSLKTGLNYPLLFDSIVKILTNSKNDNIISKLPCQLVSEGKFMSQTNNLIDAQCTISCILIGDSEVGKTSFLNRYFNNRFGEEYLSTVGIDRETKNIRIKNQTYRITIWDTAGQERFRSLSIKYYQNADSVLIFFDVTNRDSFENVNSWLKDVKENAKFSEIPVYLIGNKIDLPNRVISQEEANKYCKSIGIQYFEISCKINLNISEVVNRLILDCYLTVSEYGQRLSKKAAKSYSKCC